MNNITLVTTIFDIDISLGKSTEQEYFQNFEKLAKLDNELFVFTSPDHFDRVAEIRGDKPTTVFGTFIENEAVDLKDQIDLIYAVPDYARMVELEHRSDPKYRNSLYLTAKLLKVTFTCMAAVQAKNNIIAWVDADCAHNLPPGMTNWCPQLSDDLIHLFMYKDYDPKTTIHDIIKHNDVHVDTSCIIASKENWRRLEFLFMEGVKSLTQDLMVHDDSLFLLLASLAEPKLFKQHKSQNIFEIK